MHEAAVAAAAALLAVALTGCSGGDGAGARGSAQDTPSASLSAAPSPTPTEPYTDDDQVLLAKDDCYGPAGTAGEFAQVVETACDDPEAYGRVLKRSEEELTLTSIPDCPDPTDQVMGITYGKEKVSVTEEVAGPLHYVTYAVGHGYACVRNLKAPHPGDRGGGGMEIRVGDCLENTATGYKEIACDGDKTPDLKINKDTFDGDDCPNKDDVKLSPNTLVDRLGLSRSMLCAEQL
ncbi:hypothetical protein NLX86_22805 [Streptomyces sp. A3M-1-3]|uniref:hypothetical protein n=1 Tax=Streptomyces sp. A3M-1-3 TaxID=2962044 RepID=UPI0020B86020|nr:hypothetical protein [Streptomyces sp. A3M-1-3]MCP3820821.1 hypothetical protein [Streptomyces sp. A3M-1-3]